MVVLLAVKTLSIRSFYSLFFHVRPAETQMKLLFNTESIDDWKSQTGFLRIYVMLFFLHEMYWITINFWVESPWICAGFIENRYLFQLQIKWFEIDRNRQKDDAWLYDFKMFMSWCVVVSNENIFGRKDKTFNCNVLWLPRMTSWKNPIFYHVSITNEHCTIGFACSKKSALN